MRLRIKPTDDRVIQKLDCDGNWVDWFPGEGVSLDEFSATMRQSLQDYSNELHGIPQDRIIAPLECVEYDLLLQGNNQVLLPVHVAAGDQITVTNAHGQVSQNAGVLGVVAEYYPPQGSTVDATSSFPLETVKQMRLIMNVGGTWYDAYNITDFTIPSGVLSDNLVFMVNDDDLADNMGNIYFHVKICKASGGIWTKVFDFTVSDGGWVTDTRDGYGAQWTAAKGWGAVPGTHASASVADFKKVLAESHHITFVHHYWHIESIDPADPSAFGMDIYMPVPTGTARISGAVPNTDVDESAVISIDTSLIQGAALCYPASSGTSQEMWCTKIILQGTDPEPDWSA